VFRHVACLKWKPDADEASRQAFLENFPHMANNIPVIKGWTLGVDVGQGGEEHVAALGWPGNFDIGLTIEFDSPEGYAEYAHHPVHKEFLENYAKPVLGERIAVQHHMEA
jgi:hypothetical protein